MNLEMSLKNHTAALLSTILFVLIYISLSFVLYPSSWQNPSFVRFHYIALAINVIPAVYLHLEYYLTNRGRKYTVSEEKIVEYRSDKVVIYKKDEIESITVYMSGSVYRGSSLRFLPIDSYYYAKISLKNGNEIFITCLLAVNLEEALKQLDIVPYRRVRSFFNSIQLM